jgi:hypothetical protein
MKMNAGKEENLKYTLLIYPFLLIITYSLRRLVYDVIVKALLFFLSKVIMDPVNSTSFNQERKQLPYDPKLLHWNSLHTQNEEHMYCYCGGDRHLHEMDLQCDHCRNWFHTKCIRIKLGSIVPFITNYLFVCAVCNTKKEDNTTEETFIRTENTWLGICITALANLILQKSELDSGKLYFKKNEDLRPFVDSHWSVICTGRTRTATWWGTLGSCLYQHPELFECEDEVKRTTSLGFTLRYQSLLDIVPYDVGSKESKPISISDLVLEDTKSSVQPRESLLVDFRRSDRSVKRSSIDMTIIHLTKMDFATF